MASDDWLRCKPWIEGALEYTDGAFTIADIERGLSEHRYHFWPGEKAAIVTEFINYPQYRALNFFLIGGDLTELTEKMEPAIATWATLAGCKRILGIGRKGLERVMKSKGYRPVWVCLSKVLD